MTGTTSNFGLERAENSFQLTDLKEGCQMGRGSIVRDIRDVSPQLAGVFSARTSILDLLPDPSLVLLTPPFTSHPLFTEEATYSRGVRQRRSFNRPLLDGYSLNIKGGDVLNKTDVELEVERVRIKVIPGGTDIDNSTKEFDAAVALQQLAVAQLGRLTHTALPLQIREIQQVPTSSGDMVDIKSFLNSAEYINESTLDHAGRERLGLSQTEKVGNFLLDEVGLVPSEYLYAIKGIDIRVTELASLLYFSGPWNFFGTDSLFLLPETSGLTMYGDVLSRQGKSKDEVIRSVYKELGKVYDFDPSQILPSYIIDDNYLRALSDIPAACEAKGITHHILNQFIDRVTEVAALGHGAGFTFSPKEDMGGSFMGRNITLNGIVLDLDSVRPIGLDEMDMIAEDFNELLLTIACISRLVSRRYSSGFLDKIKSSYSDKLTIFCKDDNRKRAILEEIDTFHEDDQRFLTYFRR